MPHINAAFLCIVILIIPAIYFIKWLRFCRQEFIRYHKTPKGRVLRAWLKAKPGTQARDKAERILDKLVVRDIKRATTPCELYNAYERGLTPTTWYGRQIKRDVTPTICSASATRLEYFKTEAKKKKTADEKERLKGSGKCEAPYLEKINHRQNVLESKCYFSLLKHHVSETNTNHQLH